MKKQHKDLRQVRNIMNKDEVYVVIAIETGSQVDDEGKPLSITHALPSGA